MVSSVFQDLLNELAAHAVAVYVSIGLMYDLYACNLTFIEKRDLAFKIWKGSALAPFALRTALFTCF